MAAASAIGPAPPPDSTRSGAALSRYSPTPNATRRRKRPPGRPPARSWQPSTTIASALSWFRCALGSGAGAERRQTLLRVHDRGLRRTGRHQMEIELGGVERPRDAEPLGVVVGGVVPREVADQR